jgi:hypothetical protein
MHPVFLCFRPSGRNGPGAIPGSLSEIAGGVFNRAHLN